MHWEDIIEFNRDCDKWEQIIRSHCCCREDQQIVSDCFTRMKDRFESVRSQMDDLKENILDIGRNND